MLMEGSHTIVSSQALLDWTATACMQHGLKVNNLTSSFVDGRAFCYLLATYCPKLVPPERVKMPQKEYHHESLVAVDEVRYDVFACVATLSGSSLLTSLYLDHWCSAILGRHF